MASKYECEHYLSRRVTWLLTVFSSNQVVQEKDLGDLQQRFAHQVLNKVFYSNIELGIARIGCVMANFPGFREVLKLLRNKRRANF